jgi:hypothetical protein
MNTKKHKQLKSIQPKRLKESITESTNAITEADIIAEIRMLLTKVMRSKSFELKTKSFLLSIIQELQVSRNNIGRK